MERLYSDTLVIWLATAVAVLDVLFILVAVPESLPEKLRPASWGSQISWEKADPFGVSIFQFHPRTLEKYSQRPFTAFFNFSVLP